MKLKRFILATAGHVDHGKSALVHALTGTDPDRLPEEKLRGITIELGFAHLELRAPDAQTLHDDWKKLSAHWGELQRAGKIKSFSTPAALALSRLSIQKNREQLHAIDFSAVRRTLEETLDAVNEGAHARPSRATPPAWGRQPSWSPGAARGTVLSGAVSPPILPPPAPHLHRRRGTRGRR